MEIERKENTLIAKVKPLHLDEITVFKYLKVNHRITHENEINLRELLFILQKKEYKDQHADEVSGFFSKNPEIENSPEIIRNLEVKHKDGTNISLRILTDRDAYWAWESNSDYRPTIPVRKSPYREFILEGDFKNEDLILNYEIGFLPDQVEYIYHIIPIKSNAADGSLLTCAAGMIGYFNNHGPADIGRKIDRKRVLVEGERTLKILEDVAEARRLLEKDLANYKLLTS